MKTFFVSSTFADMQFERDAIQEIALPIINAEAKKYGQSVSFCDLRWGIDTLEYSSPAADEREREIKNDRRILRIVDTCLDEIDRCKPPMIVILGDRYGSVPKEEIIREASSRKNLQLDDYELSVTALEIEYGSLCPAKRNSPAFFYERKILDPEKAPAGYRESEERYRKKLNDLKARVGNFKTYEISFENGKPQGLEKFANLLAEDVIGYLRPQWEEFAKSTPFERERAVQWRYIEERGAEFCGRKQVVEHILSMLGRRETVVVKGDTGSGKSTLFCALALKLRELGWDVIVGGLTVFSNDALDVLRGAVYYLEEKLGVPHFSEEKDEKGQPAVHKINEWRERLGVLGSRYSEKRKFIVMLDAPERLLANPDRASLAFIPPLLNPSFRFFMTCNSDFREIDSDYIPLGPLTQEDKAEVISGILSGYGKSLDKNVVSEMVALDDSQNPLYLSFLVQRLAMMNRDDFTALRTFGRGMEAISAYQCKIVREAPRGQERLCAELLKEAGNRIDPALVQQAAEFLAASRYGLRETDLAGLLGKSWDPLSFRQFVSYMQSCFFLRDDGRIDFTHQSIREGILSRAEEPRQLRLGILRLLERLPADDLIRLEETAYQAYLADDPDSFRSLVNELAADDPAAQNLVARFIIHCYSIASEGGTEWFAKVVTGTPISAKYANFMKNMNEINACFLAVMNHAKMCAEIQEPFYNHAVRFFAEVEDKDEILPRAALFLAATYQQTADPLLVPKATPLLLKTAEYYRNQIGQGNADKKNIYFTLVSLLGAQYTSTRDPQLTEELCRATEIAAESDDPESRMALFTCKSAQAFAAYADSDFRGSILLEFEALDLFEPLFDSTLSSEELVRGIMMVQSYGSLYQSSLLQLEVVTQTFGDNEEENDEEETDEETDEEEADELTFLRELARFNSGEFLFDEEEKKEQDPLQKAREDLIELACEFFSRAEEFTMRLADRGVADAEVFALMMELQKCDIQSFARENFTEALENLTRLERQISAINNRDYTFASRATHCSALGMLSLTYLHLERIDEAAAIVARAQRELDSLELFSHTPIVLTAEANVYLALSGVLLSGNNAYDAKENAMLFRRAFLHLEQNPMIAILCGGKGLVDFAGAGFVSLRFCDEDWEGKDEELLFFAEKTLKLLTEADPTPEEAWIGFYAGNFILQQNGMNDFSHLQECTPYLISVIEMSVQCALNMTDDEDLPPEEKIDALKIAYPQAAGLLSYYRACDIEEKIRRAEFAYGMVELIMQDILDHHPQDED